jgi:hypothetical protein
MNTDLTTVKELEIENLCNEHFRVLVVDPKFKTFYDHKRGSYPEPCTYQFPDEYENEILCFQERINKMIINHFYIDTELIGIKDLPVPNGYKIETKNNCRLLYNPLNKIQYIVDSENQVLEHNIKNHDYNNFGFIPFNHINVVEFCNRSFYKLNRM